MFNVLIIQLALGIYFIIVNERTISKIYVHWYKIKFDNMYNVRSKEQKRKKYILSDSRNCCLY